MKKKLMFILTLVVALVSCSSSGGGEGSGGGNGGGTPPTPIDVTRDIPFNPADPHNIKEAKDNQIDGSGVTVGVIDSNFDVNSIEFRGTDGKTRIEKDSAYKGSTNIHGTLVSELVGGRTIGTAPGVKIKGEAAGTVCSDGSDRCIVVERGMYDKLYSQNVKIYNQSFGIDGRTIKDVTKNNMPLSDPVISFYREKASTDSLFIWAAGNSSKSEVSAEAGLPVLYPEMQKGWIAVIAVNSKDGLPSDYSNKCGIAQNWCLGAVGDYTFKVRNVTGSGTSFAAPVVTGAAALVQEKYRWMNGDLIRQTILSTATDKGNKGVDEVYGWGLLNISKAVKGPALFDKRLALGDYVNVSFDNDTSTFSNDISGDAGLIKSGTGKLVLTGNSTYTGKNIINGGTLQVNGQIVSEVNIQPSGTFASNGGYVDNSVINNGGVVMSEAKGINIQGNYISNPSGIILSEAGSTIKVGGTANLNNSSLKVISPKDENNNPVYISKNGITENVITADKGVISSFSKIDSPVFLDSELRYDSDKVILDVSRKNIAEYATETYNSDATRNNSSQNLEQVFTALDNAEGSLEFRTKAAMLQQISSSDLAATLDSLSGQIYASAQALTFQQSQVVNRDLSNRLVMLGSLDNKADVAGLWFNGLASTGKLSESGYAKADTKSFGGQIGIDKSINDNLILGLALSYSDADADFDRYGGESKSQNLGVSLYGRYGQKDDKFYVLGRLGVGFVSSDVDRQIVTGTQTENVSISHNDYVYSGYGETGYKFSVTDNVKITPYAGLSYDAVNRGSFTEDNSLLGLKADSKTYEQTSGILGIRGEYDFVWMGGKSTLLGYASWQKAFNDENLDFDAAYVGFQDQKFTVKGIGLPKDSVWTGIGISTEINDRWAWYANYDMQIDGSDIMNNVFSAGFRYNINK